MDFREESQKTRKPDDHPPLLLQFAAVSGLFSLLVSGACPLQLEN